MIVHQIMNSVGNYNYNAYTYNDIALPVHFHGNYELIYTLSGAAKITINGISNTIEEENCTLISPYSTHSLNIPEDTKAWAAVFSKDYIADFADKYTFSSFSKFKCDKSVKDFLTANLFNNQPTDRYLLQGCLYLLCGQCLKNGTAAIQNNNVDFIKDVINYITENIANSITMKETAYQLNYEYHYFSALFHKYFSMNFKRFINLLRFEQACKMLSEEESAITEICSQCGFGSLRNFNRIFKDFSGTTPKEHRNNTK